MSSWSPEIVAAIMVISFTTVCTLSGVALRGVVHLWSRVDKLEDAHQSLSEKIPPNFVAEWAVLRDRSVRIWEVLDRNSGRSFMGTPRQIRETTKALFQRKDELGVEALQNWEIEQMVADLQLVQKESEDAKEVIDARIQDAFLCGVLAERSTQRRVARETQFPSITVKPDERRPMWKELLHPWA